MTSWPHLTPACTRIRHLGRPGPCLSVILGYHCEKKHSILEVGIYRRTRVYSNKKIPPLTVSVHINQKTSNECGQFAAVCPRSSQSSQNKSAAFSFFPAGSSSFSRSQLNMSCPGRSQISHTSSPAAVLFTTDSSDLSDRRVDVELRILVLLRSSTSGRPLEDFF